MFKTNNNQLTYINNYDNNDRVQGYNNISCLILYPCHLYSRLLPVFINLKITNHFNIKYKI